MFNNRDLAILGVGTTLAIVVGLIPPFSLFNVIVGFSMLVLFMVVALLRLGPDRITVEEWARRRVRFAMMSHHFTFQLPNLRHNLKGKSKSQAPAPPAPEPGEPPVAAPAKPVVIAIPKALPVDLAFGDVGVYNLLTAFMVVVGVYFVVWIAGGGGEEIARVFEI